MLNEVFKKSNLPYLALLTSSIIWGAASPIFKWSLENIPPFTLAYLRFSIASLLIFPFAYKKLLIKKEDILTLLLIALTGVTINISFFFWGLKYTTAINSVIIASSAPIITIILSIIFLKEKPKKNIWLGTFLSLLGILIIFLEPILIGKKGGTILGDTLMLIATISAVIQTIATKKIIKKYPAETITFWTFFVGTFTFLPLLLYEFSSTPWLSSLSTKGIVGIIFGAFFSSAIAYLAYNWAIQKMEVSHMAVFTYLNPIVGIAIAVPLLGEKISIEFILGALLVLSGIILTEMHPHRFLHLYKKK